MPGPEELDRMAREAPMAPERAEEMLCAIEGLTEKLMEAYPNLAADVFRRDESDADYARRRMRELGIP